MFDDHLPYNLVLLHNWKTSFVTALPNLCGVPTMQIVKRKRAIFCFNLSF